MRADHDPRTPSEDNDRETLPPAEAARDRRRDRHSRAAERAGMRTGLAKQFKQVLDAQARRAREAAVVVGRTSAAERPGDADDVDDAAGTPRERRREHAHGSDRIRGHGTGPPEAPDDGGRRPRPR
jgi:hypothetical protein